LTGSALGVRLRLGLDEGSGDCGPHERQAGQRVEGDLEAVRERRPLKASTAWLSA
jgi:hypothetical protein